MKLKRVKNKQVFSPSLKKTVRSLLNKPKKKCTMQQFECDDGMHKFANRQLTTPYRHQNQMTNQQHIILKLQTYKDMSIHQVF